MTDELKSEQGDARIRRVIYSSVAVGDERRHDHLEILRQSRANNGLDGVSGFLWTDGHRYLQVLEGDPTTLNSLLTQIIGDPRHCDVNVISDQLDGKKAFSDWAMASLSLDRDSSMLREQVNRFLRHAPDDVRAAFGAIGSEG